jgi:hypothetical protein
MDGISWWSAKAMSFKLSRKSEAAFILKASISSKLPDFLSDYSDDVLAVNYFIPFSSFFVLFE